MLRNKTRKKTIVNEVRVAASHFSKLRGLMFESKANFNYALVFPFGEETRIKASIHMLFVFFPIAAVYLDGKKRVVDIAVLKPFALNYTPKEKAKYLIELPATKAQQVSVGDWLEF